MTTDGPVVVIFSIFADVHARAIAEQVKALGGRPAILDTSGFPSAWSISTEISGSGLAYRLAGPDFSFSSEEVAGLWWRRPKRHQVSPDITDARYQEFCRAEARSALYGLLFSLGKRVINPVAADMAAEEKPYQLATAAAAGLPIPHTLISNSPEEVAQFRRLRQGDIVYKVLTSTEWQLTETRKLTEADQETLDGVRYAPVIFQEYIDKVADVRVTLIDNKVFSAECRPVHPGAAVDWRLDSAVQYLPYDLPEPVADKLRDLHRRLGLRFGAIDLAVRPSGEHVFLETNVAGQFLFKEIHVGHPLAHAMAYALLHPPLGEAARLPQMQAAC